MHGPASTHCRRLLGLALSAFCTAAIAAPPAWIADPAHYVDPMIGTGSGGDVVGEINTFPGAALPFGMLQWSPDNGNYAGYNHDAGPIRGFSLTHASVGCEAFGDVPILPMVGAVGAKPWAHTQAFSHATEHAEPGYYAVILGAAKIRAELTASIRAGLGRFTFPASDAAQVLVKAGASLAGNSHSQVQVIGDDEVVGAATTGWFCGEGQNTYTVYFAIKFERPFTAHGVWDGNTTTPGGDHAQLDLPDAGYQARHHPGAGAWLTFDTRTQRSVRLKVALSWTSIDGARRNLGEIHGWDLAPVRKAARAAWNDVLGRIRIAGGGAAERTMFYTALYHSLLYPNTFNDVDGRYIGFDGKLHRVPPGHTQYANFSDWDTYRSLAPLQAWLFPRRASDMAQSLVNDAEQGGWIPRWPMANGYTGVMNGDNSVPLLVNLYMFGARDFDTATALKYMLKGATSAAPAQWGYIERQGIADYQRLGYVPNDKALLGHVRKGASQTLEYAIDDFAIGRFAAALGNHDVAATYARRAQNWRNIFDPRTRYLRPRDSHGAFPSGPGFVAPPAGQFGQDGFEEGNAEQYRWFVPQDIAGLVDAMGGRARVIPELDRFFGKLNVGPNLPYQWCGNEIDFAMPWLYDYVGQPWKTQALVRRIQRTLFAPTPSGMPGNDDLGAQSSWYVWSALGLYPVTPGTAVLALSTPLFPAINLRLGNGRTLRIRAPGASADTAYIERLRIDDRPWTRTWLPPARVRDGGTLEFTVSTLPDTHWGTGADAAPPSYH
jgi:predicted alpha-1,2-mannosidase